MSQEFAVAAAKAWQAAAIVLHWRPGDFWTATPAELAGALAVPDAADPPSRAMMDALRKRFPDRSE